MRRPQEAMSQRQLIDEIRLLLDATCEDCAHARCARNTATLLTLVANNPTSTFSTKVVYNIGARRHARLVRAIDDAHRTGRARGRDAVSVRRTHRSSLA
jgi:hypothetical protein